MQVFCQGCIIRVFSTIHRLLGLSCLHRHLTDICKSVSAFNNGILDAQEAEVVEGGSIKESLLCCVAS